MTSDLSLSTTTPESVESHGQSPSDPTTAIRELLNGVTEVVKARQAAQPVPAFVPAQVAEAEISSISDAISAAGQDFHSVVERIRAQYQALAELEIRRALDLALNPPTEPMLEPPVVVEATHDHDDVMELPQQEAAANPAVDEELVAGTVRIAVIGSGNMQSVAHFVDDLGQRPQFRLLQMTGSPQRDRADISLGLREPLPLLKLIESMERVASVEIGPAPEDGASTEQEVTVRLSSGSRRSLALDAPDANGNGDAARSS